MKKRILIIRNDKLGDCINTFPMIDTIKKKYPSWEIDILASPHNAIALENHLYINKTFVTKIKKRRKRFFNTRVKLYNLYLYFQLRKRHYDILFNTRPDRPNNKIKIINAKKVFYADKNSPIHNTQRYLQMLQHINITPEEYIHTPKFFTSKESIKKVNNFKKKIKNKTIIFLNTTGGGKDRSFNDQFVIEFSKNISDLNKKNYYIIISTFSDTVKKHFKDFPHPSISTTFNTSILDLFNLIKISNVVISPDTSVVHIASAMKKNLFCFYNKNNLNIIVNGPWSLGPLVPW